jgi:hypothetical protein
VSTAGHSRTLRDSRVKIARFCRRDIVTSVVQTLCVLALAAVLAGCGSSPAPTEPTGFIALDVAPGLGLGVGPTGGCGDVAFADLRLRGDPATTPSIWVELVETGERLAARWPPGFRARFEPGLVVYDAHSRAVLRGGDVLTSVSGYPADAPQPMRLFSFNGVDYPCE